MTSLFIFLITLLTVIPAMAIADQSVITKDGKEVLLKDDGSWEYIAHIPANIKYAEEAV